MQSNAESAKFEACSIPIAELISQARQDNGGVLVLGGGVTGAAVAEKFSAAGIKTAIIDQAAVSPRAKALGIQIFENFNPQTQALPAAAAFAVISPGIGPNYPLPALVRAAGIPIVTELDIAFALLGMPLVAVTGTNGKTTTVTIIDAMLQASGIDTALVGNVGTPPIEFIEAQSLTAGIKDRSALVSASPALVAEVSSYQLECARTTRPRVGVWLNLDDNHLERHKTIEGYLGAKARLFEDQDPAADFSVVCADDPYCPQMIKLARGRLAVFGQAQSDEGSSSAGGGRLPFGAEIGCIISNDGTTAVFSGPGGVEKYDLSKTRLLGAHNRLNLAASICAARLAGGSCAGIQQTIESFEPIEHRIEVVSHPSLIVINDSKSTNPLASAVALSAVCGRFPDKKIVLVLGGAMKQGSWKPLAVKLSPGELGSAVSALLVFGPDREKIISNLQAECPGLKADLIEQFSKIKPAIERALILAAEGPGRVLLFSPGCASFDEFTDYTARGRYFKQQALEPVCGSK